jgi:hypothetical protein
MTDEQKDPESEDAEARREPADDVEAHKKLAESDDDVAAHVMRDPAQKKYEPTEKKY